MPKENHSSRLYVPAELRLVAACCDRPKSEIASARIEGWLKTVTDWKALRSTAMRHHVEGFVFDRLKACNDVPVEVLQSWRNIENSRVRNNLLQSHVTSKLHALLNQHNVPNIVLKGLPMSEQLYGSLVIRRSGDIDLLVSQNDTWDAVQLLASAGFLPIETKAELTQKQTRSIIRHFKEITLVNSGKVVVDLHWKMVEAPGAFMNFDPIDSSRSVVFNKSGEIAVLSEAEQFAYLCMHGALADWSRLKWLSDINAMIGSRNDQEVLSWYNRADEVGCGPAVLQALGLREIFWENPPPKDLKQLIEQIDEQDFFVLPIDRMLAPYRTASSREAISRIRRQFRVRSILFGSSLKTLKASTTHMRALPDVLALPLPKALDWLYYPLRPLLWLNRKLRPKKICDTSVVQRS